MAMTFGVLQFPGSNCDDDALRVVDTVLAPQGSRGRMIWHKERSLGDLDALIVPGGFSYGDYLRGGAIAAHSPIMNAVVEFAAAGGPVLGICNGFQILCERQLLDGALARNRSLRFECRDVHVRVEGITSPFTRDLPRDRPLRMSIAHAEGRYVHPDVEALDREGRILFRYVTADGEVTDEVNPNGSVANIAGVCNRAGNVVGLMPHPERACEPILGRGGDDGRALFRAALAHAQAGGTR